MPQFEYPWLPCLKLRFSKLWVYTTREEKGDRKKMNDREELATGENGQKIVVVFVRHGWLGYWDWA